MPKADVLGTIWCNYVETKRSRRQLCSVFRKGLRALEAVLLRKSVPSMLLNSRHGSATIRILRNPMKPSKSWRSLYQLVQTIYTYVHIYMYTHTCIYTYMYTYIYMSYIHAYVHIPLTASRQLLLSLQAGDVRLTRALL